MLRPVLLKYHLRNEEVGDNNRAVDVAHVPVTLAGLKVTRPSNTYLLQISYRSPDPALSATIANAIAESYIEHAYDIRIHSSAQLANYTEKQIGELRTKMEKSSAALAQFETELNVINPAEKTNILSARLLQLNTEYTAAQGDRDRKQAAFDSVKNGTLEAASHQDDALQSISDRLNNAGEKFAEIKARVGAHSPGIPKSECYVCGSSEAIGRRKRKRRKAC